MQTSISEHLRDTADGKEANRILRACTHCGFCTATCPTYQLLGDERDSPRGRIYLMKQVLEGATPSASTQLHLDRCLTCRMCETTCPSGVEYAKLLDIGRELVDAQVPRPAGARLTRWGLRQVLPYRRRFGLLLALGRLARPLLRGPLTPLRHRIPPRQPTLAEPDRTQLTRRMLVLDGCVQPSATPATNAAAAQVLARFGIELITAPQAGCCGALSRHLSARAEADAF
ncbi:MAG TPA: 4Fe-4S dicluster domain-containing protein, partial [Salinisphaeraceae bacterium]|nr:4Fe-4S dicluster domain-containing protein [Salinisphaeraceae bacterium]